VSWLISLDMQYIKAHKSSLDQNSQVCTKREEVVSERRPRPKNLKEGHRWFSS